MSRVVVKLGGRVAADSTGYALEHHAAGDEVVVVHGAGAQITAELERLGQDGHGYEIVLRVRLRTSSRNSRRRSGSRNAPRQNVVIVDDCSSTPRMCVHRCSAER